MLNIPESVKALYKIDGTRKNFRVQFPNGEMADLTNADVVRESVHFTESICSQNVFRFGLAEASVIEFETVGVGNMYGMTIACSYEIDTGSLSAAEISAIQADPGDGELVLASSSDIGYGFYRVPLGVFRVERCPRNHGAMTHRQVTGYSQVDVSSYALEGRFPYDAIEMDRTAILSIAFPSYRTATGGTASYTHQNVQYAPTLYDSSGTPYKVDVAAGSVSVGAENYTSAIYERIQNGYTETPRFFVNTSNRDSEHFAAGERAAAALDASGLDLRYNSSGVKVYQTNQEALQAVLPALFFCVIPLRASYNLGVGYVIARYGTPAPLISSSSSSPISGTATVGGVSVSSPIIVQSLYATNASLVLSRNRGTALTHVMPFTGIQRLAQGSFYALPNTTGKVRISNSGSIGDGYASPYSGNSSSASPKFTVFSFDGAFDMQSLVSGDMECRGVFMQNGRDDTNRELTLSQSSPLAISPGDYDEVWWDEYDVSPIGTVTVTYRNGEEGEATANVTLGAGSSLYDMTDNEVLKNLSEVDLDSITELLSGDFAQNAQNVGFTPVEMTAQGWPWLEAGDALQITAEDGTVVNTYALRVEMSGIQHLMSDITAEGGEIIGEV